MSDTVFKEIDRPYTAKDLYTHFRGSLEKRSITVGAAEYDDVGDDVVDGAVGWFTYRYTSSDASANDVLLYCDESSVGMSCGLISFEHELPDSKMDAIRLLDHYTDTVEMALNGQLVTVVTSNTKTDQPQAVELVVVDDKAVERNVMTVASYTHTRGELSATAYRNNEPYKSVTLHKEHFLWPAIVNGREVVGRTIDLNQPTPLSKKEYAAHEQSVVAQLTGGDPDEALWQLFYRRIEFWIICLTVGAPIIWAISLIPDSEWWSTPAYMVGGLVGTLLIIFLTSYFLARRQMLVDEGKTPVMERVEEYVNSRSISWFFAASFIYNLLVSPLWTTKEHPDVLLSTFQYPDISPLLVVAAVGVGIAMVVVRPVKRINKFVRTSLMMVSYGIILYCNFFIAYGGDGAASAATIPTLLITVLPVAIILWYSVDCFRPIRHPTLPPK